MQHRIPLINQKGGVGKTTNAVNIAAHLVEEPWNRKVLLVDLDPQAQATIHCGIRPNQTEFSPAYEVLVRGKEIKEFVRRATFGAVDILAGGSDLATARRYMSESPSGLWVLKEALDQMDAGTYDVVLIDCPPAIDHLARSALIASTGFIVSMVMQQAPLEGFAQLLDTVAEVRKRENPDLLMVGILGCNTPRGSSLAQEVREDLVNEYGVESMFRREVRYSEHIAKGIKRMSPPIVAAPGTIGVEDYAAVVEELVERGAA